MRCLALFTSLPQARASALLRAIDIHSEEAMSTIVPALPDTMPPHIRKKIEETVARATSTAVPENAVSALGRMESRRRRNRSSRRKRKTNRDRLAEAEAKDDAKAIESSSDDDDKIPERFGPYTVKEVQELGELFDQFDGDESGEIDASEFMQSTVWQDSNLSMVATGSIFNSIDSDASGTIDIRELCVVTFPVATKRDIDKMVKFLVSPRWEL